MRAKVKPPLMSFGSLIMLWLVRISHIYVFVDEDCMFRKGCERKLCMYKHEESDDSDEIENESDIDNDIGSKPESCIKCKT